MLNNNKVKNKNSLELMGNYNETQTAGQLGVNFLFNCQSVILTLTLYDFLRENADFREMKIYCDN